MAPPDDRRRRRRRLAPARRPPLTLARPQALPAGRPQLVTAAACFAIIAVIGLGEALWAPTVTFGAVLLLVAFAGAWLLRPRGAALVVAAAMASPFASCLGRETLVAAEVKSVAALIMGIVVRFCVRELTRSQRELTRRAEQVTRANRSLERFTADAAHELRAPLALIRSEVDLAVAGAEPRTRRHLEAIADEVARMGRLTSTLLTLSRADAGTLELAATSREVDLVDLLELGASRWRTPAAARGIALATELPDAGVVAGDPTCCCG